MATVQEATRTTKTKEKKEVRKPNHPPIYIDLSELEDSENPQVTRLIELIEAREELKKEEDAAKTRRLAADAEIEKALDLYHADGFIVNDFVAQRIVSRSGEKADKQYLAKKLNPSEMKRAFVAGTEYSYMTVREDGNRAEKIREGLE